MRWSFYEKRLDKCLAYVNILFRYDLGSRKHKEGEDVQEMVEREVSK